MSRDLKKMVLFIFLLSFIFLIPISVYAQENLNTDEEEIMLHIESAIQNPIQGSADITGWAISKDPIDKIEIFIGDNIQGQAEYGIERLDRYEIYSSYPNTLNSGFKYILDSPNLRDGEYTVFGNRFLIKMAKHFDQYIPLLNPTLTKHFPCGN